MYRNQDAHDELLCASGCSGSFAGTPDCVFFAFGSTNCVDVLRVAPAEDGTAVDVRAVAHFDAFPPRDTKDSEDDDIFNPNEVTAVHISVPPRPAEEEKEEKETVAGPHVLSCVAGSGSGAVVLWDIDVDSGNATRAGALPDRDAAPDENKVKCLARAGSTVAAVTLGDGRCRVWDAAARTLLHTWDAAAFGLAPDTRPLMRFCALSPDGARVTVAAASRVLKDRRAGCWLASRGTADSACAGALVALPGAAAMASCSLCERPAGGATAAVGTCDGGVLVYAVGAGRGRACRTLAAPACHGLVTTATNALALADGPLLVLSAGTDGTCRVHRPPAAAPPARCRACVGATALLVAVAAVVLAALLCLLRRRV